MNCLEFRQAALADPGHLAEAAQQHVAACRYCERYLAEIRDLDQQVAEELNVAIPEGLAARVLLNQTFQHRRSPGLWLGLAAAASVLVGVLLVLTLDPPALEDDVIAHMEYQAHQVHGTTGDLADDYVKEVLDVVNGVQAGELGKVAYASPCKIDKQLIAHLVVERDGETFSLFVMPQELKYEHQFSTERWRGTIAPHGNGSLAVIANATSSADIASAANYFGKSIQRHTI